MEFSRQECWSKLPFPSPGIFPTQGLNPWLLFDSHLLLGRQILCHWVTWEAKISLSTVKLMNTSIASAFVRWCNWCECVCVRWEYFSSILLATYNAILLTIIITSLYIRSPEFTHLITRNLISLQSKGLSRVFSQHHSSKTSILLCSAFFFMVQISHPYRTTTSQA